MSIPVESFGHRFVFVTYNVYNNNNNNIKIYIALSFQ